MTHSVVKAKVAFQCMWGGQLMEFKAGVEIDHPALVSSLRKTDPHVLDEPNVPEPEPLEVPTEPDQPKARRKKSE